MFVKKKMIIIKINNMVLSIFNPFGTNKSKCQQIKQQSLQVCERQQQYKKKSYRQRFSQTSGKHEEMIKYIKILIILGMIIMAGMFQYVGFIKKHWDLFLLELLTYVSCSLAAYIFLNFVRNQDFMSTEFFVGAFIWAFFTIVIVFAAEIAGMNTKFMHESHNEDNTLEPVNKYREEGLNFKKELWGKMIVGVNVTFIVALSLYHLVENDRSSFILLVFGVLIAILSIWLPQVKKINQYLRDSSWIPKDMDIPDSYIGMAIFYSTIFVIFTFIVLITSLLRYDSFKIYSYFPDKKICGPSRMVLTVLLFMVESFIVAALFAVPILYVSSNRNKPELGHEYKFAKDKEAFIDFGLLTFKIFIFLVALQMTGLFDSYNKGFQRVDGCNVRKK